MAKLKRTIGFMILFSLFTSINSFTQDSKTLFASKNDTIIIPFNEAAIMAKDNFLEYYLTKNAFDSIKTHLPDLENKLNELTKMEKQKSVKLEALIKEQEQTLKSKELMIAELYKKIEESTALSDDCIKRAQKASKYRLQRNIFMGSSGALMISTVILLIVAI